ncbi:MAG: SMI1/KNR4 family protein [Fuerstiella sp.]|jgi:hypothetical protein|nr:SMI1/KNR4 family protein [Fuerstiella sp.]
MPPEILDQITELVGNVPPEDYLGLLHDYPEALQSINRAIDDSESEGTVADVELIRNPSCILEINREARVDSVLDPDGTEFFWPDQLMIIGETGAGDYYCIDVDQQVAGVMQFDHHSVGFEVIADSLNEFVDMLEETFSGEWFEEDEPEEQ